MPNIRLTKADERGLSVPAHSVISIVGIENEPNKPWPTAKSVIRYDYGSGVGLSFVVEAAPDVMAQVTDNDISARPWVELLTPDGDALFVLAPAIVFYEGLPTDPAAEGPQPQGLINFDGNFGGLRKPSPDNPATPDIKFARVAEDYEEIARRIEETLRGPVIDGTAEVAVGGPVRHPTNARSKSTRKPAH